MESENRWWGIMRKEIIVRRGEQSTQIQQRREQQATHHHTTGWKLNEVLQGRMSLVSLSEVANIRAILELRYFKTVLTFCLCVMTYGVSWSRLHSSLGYAAFKLGKRTNTSSSNAIRRWLLCLHPPVVCHSLPFFSVFFFFLERFALHSSPRYQSDSPVRDYDVSTALA